MALEPGARVGDYEIVGPLGTGGMSEVYRARDLKLGREVAIKLLPRVLAHDPDKRARLEREAQLLAALNHKNIAVIHGLEQEEGAWYLVLELIPGDTLAERMHKQSLPLDEVRAIFIQIAEALEAAHDKGIIHRDLKPANVKISPDGTVKLLDFGLGKELMDPATLSHKTETFDGTATSPGVVIGTPAYMSPEQARGQTIGKGTDVWSFGVCLFEAISGVHPFARETIPDVLSAILNDPPPWGRLPSELPHRWGVLLERCLRKKQRDRLHDIADVRIELQEAPSEVSPVPPRGGVTVSPWALAAAGAALVLFAWLGGRALSRPDAATPVARRFVIDLPPTATLSLDGASALAVSPDGARLVYSGRRAQRSQLYQRALDQLEVLAVPGTEGGVGPFFSPDGDTLGFFADGKLKALGLSGGNPLSLAVATAPRGASWIRRRDGGEILFASTHLGGLRRVVETGGTPETVLGSVDETAPTLRWPQALPGVEMALATLWTRGRVDIGVVELGTGRVTTLVENGTYPRFTVSGHLVFARGGALHAARLDARSLELDSDPVLVVEDVAVDELTGAAFYDVSAEGTLFYVAASSEIASPASMLLVTRNGTATPIGPPKASFQVPRFSPDGRVLSVTVQEGDVTDIWSLHLDRGPLTRLTLDGTSGAAIWTPDGERVTFSSAEDGEHAIYWKRADGSGNAERLTEPGNFKFPTSWSPDGATLAYTELHPDTALDVWTFSLDDGSSRPLLRSAFSEAGAVFSPDGRYLAFTSDESGREEAYVRAYPGASRWQISTEGGNEPVWSPDGKKLFFRSGRSLMVVDVATTPEFEATKPRVLFEAPFDRAGALHANYDVAPDGRHFVMIHSENDAAADRIHVVLHWLSELSRRVPKS